LLIILLYYTRHARVCQQLAAKKNKKIKKISAKKRAKAGIFALGVLMAWRRAYIKTQRERSARE
jgi:hypothetical protein